MMLMFAALVSGFAPVVHAANPTLTNATSGGGVLTNTGSSCTGNIGTNIASLTFVTVIMDVVLAAPSTSTSPPVVATMSDTYGLTFVKVLAGGLTQNGVGNTLSPAVDLETWYFTGNTPAGSDTLTLTLTGTAQATSCGDFNVDVINTEMFPINPQFTTVSGGSTGTQTLYPNSPSNAVLANSFVYAFTGVSQGTGATSFFAASVSYPTVPNPNGFTQVMAPLQFQEDSANGNYCTKGQAATTTPFCALQWGTAKAFFASGTTTGAMGVSWTTASSPAGYYAAAWTLSIVWNPTPSASASSQTQTIGSCPPGGGTGVGHYALANNTQYWYEGNALGAEVVNTIQIEVASIKGSGSHTLQLMLYGTQTAQNPSVGNAAFQLYTDLGTTFTTIPTGTTNLTITLQVSIPLGSAIGNGQLPFNFWAVAVVGDDHISISGSTLSGLFTQAGGASSANVQALAFNSNGASSANKLAMCAKGSYQSILSFTSTITSIQSATTTTVITSTSIVTTIGTQLFSTSSNWPVMFLILMLPAGLFLGVTKTLAGGILGLMIGAILGLMMGILPSWIFIGLVIAMAAIAFVVRERSS